MSSLLLLAVFKADEILKEIQHGKAFHVQLKTKLLIFLSVHQHQQQQLVA